MTPIEKLQKEFNEHQHTGSDSKKLKTKSEGSLTAKDTGTVDSTYGSAEATVINNNRIRIQEIEIALIAAGILS